MSHCMRPIHLLINDFVSMVIFTVEHGDMRRTPVHYDTIKSRLILKNMVTLGEKIVFIGMSLVIMKEEKHRKLTICCESRFISNGIFLNIFHGM